MRVPRKLKWLVSLYLAFLGTFFYKASDFVDFWDPYGGLPHHAAIEWGLGIIFVAVSVWFGCKAFVLLRDDNPDNDRRR
jgi:hypothetical protein